MGSPDSAFGASSDIYPVFELKYFDSYKKIAQRKRLAKKGLISPNSRSKLKIQFPPQSGKRRSSNSFWCFCFVKAFFQPQFLHVLRACVKSEGYKS